jgi:hypothetical protein
VLAVLYHRPPDNANWQRQQRDSPTPSEWFDNRSRWCYIGTGRGAPGKTFSPVGAPPSCLERQGSWPGLGSNRTVEFHRSAAQPGYAWLIETVDPQPYTGVGTSLALDGQDRPHIAYEYAYGGLRYAAFDGTRWHTATVDGFGPTGIGPSLALDAAGRPHIAYRLDGDYMDLLYADFVGTRWLTETVESAGDAGGFSSLVLDAQGYPHVSDNRDSCLIYASRIAPARGLEANPAWQVETVACGSGWYGWNTSLKLDAQGRPRISYQAGWPNGDLMYAWHDGAQWHIELVDSQGETGYHTSLALDSQGHPHISYYDDTLKALKYAWHDGITWHIEIVDTGGVGSDCSLALDAAGHPHISYYDETHYDLRYASFDGTRWLTETVDAVGDYTGQHTSLALDSQGRPHISYRGSMYWLRYARLVALPYTVFLPWIER